MATRKKTLKPKIATYKGRLIKTFIHNYEEECNCCMNKKTPIVEAEICLNIDGKVGLIIAPHTNVVICLDCEQKLKTRIIDQETKKFHFICSELIRIYVNQGDPVQVDFKYIDDLPTIDELRQEIKKMKDSHDECECDECGESN